MLMPKLKDIKPLSIGMTNRTEKRTNEFFSFFQSYMVIPFELITRNCTENRIEILKKKLK